MSDGTNAFGALALLSDSRDLYVCLRTSSQTKNAADGASRQGIPGFSARELTPSNTIVPLMFLTESGAFRSTIGLLNGVGLPITISWKRYRPAGVRIEKGSVEQPAWGTL